MQTLDEVIKALEYCTGFDFVRCQDCPGYSEPDCGIQNDALHYLKAFRDAKDTLEAEKERYQEAVSNCNAVETKYMLMVKEALRNDPLSWSDLKQMEGKPVWYEHEFWKGWIILGKVEQGVNCEMIPDREEKWYIVKDGSAKAYRKERE